MIFSEDVRGNQDGWFNHPEELLDYAAAEGDIECPEFAFVGKKCVRKFDLWRAVEQMTEDTYEGAELRVTDADWKVLQEAVDRFNEKYAVTYYEHDYTMKVRVSAPQE